LSKKQEQQEERKGKVGLKTGEVFDYKRVSAS
jgi:hypothetical protein